MKPLLLEFAGLHSYREPQRVDFSQLLGGGLFGIFGPTGSGKSTILDAITLALYGTVDRADRNTRGILNQAEQQLWVKFAFALNGPGGELSYRVERSFKREDETAVRAAHCRLVALSPAREQVLADKPSEVTAHIQEILGLRVEDFTRAVVLPQGKFAQFLHEEPKGRREMLQRLFSLHQYGDRLIARTKAQVIDVEKRLAAVTAEQVGLGDASSDAVADAAARLAGASEAAAQAEAALVRVEQEHKEWQRVWEVQQELERLQASLSAWRERETEAGVRRGELQSALRAEQVRPALAERKAAAAALDAASVKHAAAAQEQAAASAAQAHAAADHGEAHERRTREEPGLIEKQVRLGQAVSLEAEVQALVEQVKDLAGRVDAGQAHVAQTRDEADRLAAEAERLQAEQAALLTRMAAVRVDAGRRQQVQQALMTLRSLREAEEAVAQAQERLHQRSLELETALVAAAEAAAAQRDAGERLAAHEAAFRKLEAEPPASEDDLRAAETWLARARDTVDAVTACEAGATRAADGLAAAEAEAARLTWAVAAAEAAEAAARAAVEQARERLAVAKACLDDEHRQDMAGALAGGLAPGAPCPVCGATEHPHPAVPQSTAALADAQAAVAAAEAALPEAERKSAEAGRAAADARGLAGVAGARAQAARQAWQEDAERLAAARQSLPVAWRDLPAADLPGRMDGEREETERRRRQYNEWKMAVENARRAKDDLVKSAGQAAAAASSAEATAGARQKARDDAAAQAHAAAQVREARSIEFDWARGDLDPAGLEAERRRIEAADRAAAALQEELTEKTAAREQADRDLREKQSLAQKYADALKEREQQHLVAAEQLRAREQQLQSLTGGGPAAPLLAAVEARLRSLEQAETQARERAEATCLHRSQADAALAAATREHELAGLHQAKADGALAEALSAAGFSGEAEAEAALRSPERRRDLESWLKEHDREGERLAEKTGAIESELAGRSLTGEEWAARQAGLQTARIALEAARDERTRAAKTHEDLTAKQARWTQLEEQRQVLASRYNNLTELQTLLRGNAFVEFLAEGQLQQVAQAASERLGQLTRHRYALEIDSGGGFIIRDDMGGGLRRPVSTLSGGETFLSSLALALTLSAQIQLRGRHPLEFFFLDEGFGTLDPELLNLVIDTLEGLHFERLHVGIISHVPELRSRLQRRLVVDPAEAGGTGSHLRLELG